MGYGITDSGFLAKPLEVILAEIEEAEKTVFGASLDVAAQSIFGQVNGIMAERFAELWQLAEAVYSAFYPDSAAGAQLDNVASLTGTARLPPTLSKVIAACCGTPTTVLVAGRVASVTTLGHRFASVAEATITAVSAWQAGHAYAIGDRCTNGNKVFECTDDGTSAGSGGPSGSTTVGASVTDNTVTWLCIGSGTGAVDVQFNAQAGGPKNANAGTLATIETPVAGWASVFNVEDQFYLGTNLESDASFRVRREQELRAIGNAASDAIRQAVLAVTGVYGCHVFENYTDTTDGDGLPPHSVEVVVQGGDDTAVREAVFASVAAGVQTYGTTSGVFIDSQGVEHTVKFSRPTDMPIYVTINATVDPVLFPVDGANQIGAALLAYGVTYYTNGSDVVSAALLAQVFKVSGVVDCDLPLIGLAPTPGASSTIPLNLRQIPVLDSARITVNVS